MKDTLHFYFCDFWEDFDKQDNMFVGTMRSAATQVIVDEQVTKDTDLVICSCFGKEHLAYIGKKKILYYSGENDFPTYMDYDYAITHNDMTFARHLRIPLWVSYNYDRIKNGLPSISKPFTPDESWFDRKFCADVISNVRVAWSTRFTLSDQIEKYKPMDHGGEYKNNVGGCVDNKIDFLSGYKFSMATENSDLEGYVTEKIFDSFAAHTIPIYLGTKDVTKDFNPGAFINVRDYKTYSELLDKIKELDNDKEKYMNMISQCPLAEFELYETLCEKMRDFIWNIIEHGTIRHHKYGRIGLYLHRLYGVKI